MDPLSVSASVSALIGATGVVVGYLRDLKDGDEQRQRLLDEVTNLWAVLSHLGEQVQRKAPTSRYSGSTSLKAIYEPDGIIEQCHKTIEDLENCLRPAEKSSGRLLQKMRWSLSKDEVQRKIDQLHRYQTMINGALVQTSLSLSEEILDHSTANRILLEEKKNQAIKKWLSPLNTLSQHTEFSSSYCPGTGNAFIESSTFREWSITPKQTLWCSGAPGTGKTYLSVIAANHLRARFPHALVLVVHCQYDDPACQKVENILGDLLRQSLLDDNIPERLTEMYHSASVSGMNAPLESLVEILSDQLAVRSENFLILDAVDEVIDSSERRRLLDLTRPESLGGNVLITSRPLGDIKASVEPAGHFCDGCQVEAPRFHHFTELYRCYGGCDYDLCPSCYETGLRCDQPEHCGLTKLVKHNFRYNVWAQRNDLQSYVEWRIDSDAAIGSFLAARTHLRKELIDSALSQTNSW
jgi:hypothetical protein